MTTPPTFPNMSCPIHHSYEEWEYDSIYNLAIAIDCPCSLLLLNTHVAPSSTTAYTDSVPGGDADDAIYTNTAGYVPGAPVTIDPHFLSGLPAEQSAPYMIQNANTQYAPAQTYPTHSTDVYEQPSFSYPFAMTPHVTQNVNVQHSPAETYRDVYEQAPFGDPSAATEPPVPHVAADTAAPIICFFGGPCPHLAPDTLLQKVTGVKRHLEAFHQLPRDRADNLVCDWAVADKDGRGTDRCGKDVKDVIQLAKHVATVHLQLLKVRCEDCGELFSRRDSLDRHKKEGRCSLG